MKSPTQTAVFQHTKYCRSGLATVLFLLIRKLFTKTNKQTHRIKPLQKRHLLLEHTQLQFLHPSLYWTSQFVSNTLSYSSNIQTEDDFWLAAFKSWLKPDVTHCTVWESKAFTPSLPKGYLSMFLLLALRRATIPSFASASKENGSIPWKQRKGPLRSENKETNPPSGWH